MAEITFMDSEDKKTYTTCKEANYYCDKCQYNEAEVWEQEELNSHLSACPSCREYSARNSKLTLQCNQVKFYALSPQEREAFKDLLKQEIEKQES